MKYKLFSKRGRLKQKLSRKPPELTEPQTFYGKEELDCCLCGYLNWPGPAPFFGPHVDL